MNRSTIAVFGWIVAAIIMFALMIAFATPLGEYVVDNIQSIPSNVSKTMGVCNHSNVNESTSIIQYSNTKHVEVKVRVCRDCGKTLDKVYTGNSGDHSYNASYVCTICGYKHIHSFVSSYSLDYEMIEGNEYFHYETSERRCDCGAETTSTVKSAHNFAGTDKCVNCGYEKQVNEDNTLAEPSQSGVLTYNGTAQTPSWGNFDPEKLSISGETSSANAGTYIAIFTPLKGYTWENGSTDSKNISWTIEKKPASIVVNNASRKYGVNNPAFSGTITGLTSNGDLGTVSYVTTASKNSNVGTYAITPSYTTNNNYDLTITNGTLTITKADPTISAVNKSVSVGNTVAIGATITSGSGSVTYVASPTSVATVSSSGVITGVSAGTATITINVSGNENYNSASNNITVTVSATSSYTWKKYNIAYTGGTTTTVYEYNYHSHTDMDGDLYETLYLTDDEASALGISPGENYYHQLDTYDYEEYTYVRTTTETSGSVASCGSYIGTVTSSNSSAYPTNGTQGGYWYIKQ